MTTIDSFRSSVSAAAPPKDASPALQALWWLAKDDWKRAHEVVQQHEDDPNCNWVHAHLHRQEGDMNNAGGWYRRAGKPVATSSLQEEWAALATKFLAGK
jgi:hypothetical protein